MPQPVARWMSFGAVLLLAASGCRDPAREPLAGEPPRPAASPAASPRAAGALAAAQRYLDAGEREQARSAYERALAQAEAAGDRAGAFAALIGLGDADPPQSDGRQATAAFARARAMAVGRQQDVVEAHVQFDRGVRAAGRQDLEQAAAGFERALAVARRSGERSMEARALNALGNVALRRDELARAEALYRQAVRAAVGTGSRIVPILAHRGLGDATTFLGRTAEALRHYETALTLARRAGHRELTEGILNSTGATYLDLADYGRALRCFEEALRTGTDDRDELAWLLNNLGIAHSSQGNSELGREYFRRALRIAEEQGDDYGRMRMLNNLGLGEHSDGRQMRAREYFSRALGLAEAVQDREAQAGHWRSLASTYEAERRFDLAEAAYGKSLGLAEAIGNRSLTAQALHSLAGLRLERRKYGKALELADRAAAIAAGSGSREVFWLARTVAGRALRALGRDERARLAYAEAIATVEEVRDRRAGGEFGGEAFLEGRLAPYHAMIELAAERGEAATALAYAERAKGRVLVESLRNGRVDLDAQLTPEERATERRLRERLGSLNREIFLARSRLPAGGGAPWDLERRLQRARRDLESFNAGLYASRPGLRTRRADFPDWTLGKARRLLAGGDAVLLEYVVLPDRTYLFAIAADGPNARPVVRLHRLPVGREELAREVEAFRGKVGSRDLDVLAAARRLHDLLLAPAAAVLRGRRLLCIVPDGALWDLPFQALQPGDSTVLLERHAVYYAPSLSVLSELVARRPGPARSATAGRRRRSLLAVGNPEPSPGTLELAGARGAAPRQAALPAAEWEVRSLRRLYGPRRSAVYTAARASEARVKAESGSHRVLHFATHALLDDQSPLYSSLVLARTAGDRREDGLLEAWEILGLHLDADLVVLSACQTARGRPRAGEGMIGMTWALAAAGSSATVASQWEVDSASTGRLMVALHRGWLAGLGKAEALRRAALAIRRQERYRHPFYWAAFGLVGDGG